jgi:2-polyprenyl-6-methoxyphenol hydroxylase-like FAD-dependent oxidoreductase
MAPWLADRTQLLRSWDQVKLLEVGLDRLRRWHRPGLLCIGDAAHAMSPVGGVGINLAVQDAVAAARVLAGPLLRGGPAPSGGNPPRLGGVDRAAARVQRRRWPATATTQAAQRIAHRLILAPRLASKAPRSRWTARCGRRLLRSPLGCCPPCPACRCCPPGWSGSACAPNMLPSSPAGPVAGDVGLGAQRQTPYQVDTRGATLNKQR